MQAHWNLRTSDRNQMATVTALQRKKKNKIRYKKCTVAATVDFGTGDRGYSCEPAPMARMSLLRLRDTDRSTEQRIPIRKDTSSIEARQLSAWLDVAAAQQFPRLRSKSIPDRTSVANS